MTYHAAPKRVHAALFTLSSVDNFGMVYGYGPAHGTVAWPLANLAIYVPFSVDRPMTALEGWAVMGATAGGNFDIGIYDDAGARLTSSGSTARAVTDTNNTTALTNLDLLPDRYYYMAISHDGTSNFIAHSAAAVLCASMGVMESTTSFVLPSSPTLAITTRAFLPAFGLNFKATSL